jgi:peptidoglycan/xylan/chitin deacetylase (PgdA/CDA1 family)
VNDVSRRTRIKAAINRGIERGDYSACGGDFYARGHIRAIARAVGAAPGPLIADYDAARRRQPAITAGPRPGLGWPGTRRFPLRPVILAVTGALVLGLVVAGVAGFGGAAGPARPGVAWVFSAASNTVAIRLTPPPGPSSRRLLAHSRLVVSEYENGRLSRQSPGRRAVDVPVPPGRRTRIVVRVEGPQPSSRTLTVTAPPALRIVGSRRVRHGVVVSVSGPLRPLARRTLCGRDQVSLPASREVAVASSPRACRARLRLTDRDGEQAVVPVAVPALPEVPVYSFADPARRAIYITVDDGWTPSRRVLSIMRRTHLPVTTFLIGLAARRDLPYWRAFVEAGGTVGDHTLSHPNLTRLTLARATAQWEQDRQALGRWLGRTPVLARPPYGAFDLAVEAAAYRAGLKKLVGWSAVVDSDGIQTWDDRALQPGEIVLLHWVPGLGSQLTRLLAVIRARHLRPAPLTAGSFAGITPQRRSLDGD